MGAICCVAAKSRTITNRPSSETMQRQARYSPSWSFRCDNRGRVAGEEIPANWLHNGGGGNSRVDVKSGTLFETAFASDEGSPLDSFRSPAWQNPAVSGGNTGVLRFPSSDQSMSCSLVKVKEPTETPYISCPSPTKKLSPAAPSVSSLSTSPLSSQSHDVHPNSTPSTWHHLSPGRLLLRQVSDSRIPEYKSPTFSISEEASSFFPPVWGNDSNRGSNGGSSDSWSIPGFSEIMTNRTERWSFDSETSRFSRGKNTCSVGHSGSSSLDLQTCGVCSKLLTERSSFRWNSHISSNELAVVSVLTCGHVYHSECLENMTPEINKYDPDCPVCIFGEKRVMKMSGKALKAELDSKARKRLKKRVVDSEVHSNFVFDLHRNGEVEGRGPKMSSSSSMRSSLGKPFLWRPFSFNFKVNRFMSENQSTRKKGFFWGRSMSENQSIKN
ncbi:hypothetical protein F511_25292 [Dorcoceras hygrometricum]|uniref:RING-type domain-containing protein n=1 Tax=Dorcoceras hygrometricum TaxID=472368 RepID=A0A2Z7D5T7_9LAMI|nr:hypothetical protein F511_25292 [Dorcoceras hygrometricum]